MASLDESGEVRIWSLAEGAGLIRVLQGPRYRVPLLLFDPEGHRVITAGLNNSIHLWGLDDPPDAQPVVLRGSGPATGWVSGAFDPGGHWLATTYSQEIEFWALSGPRARILPGFALANGSRVAFTSDSRWLVTCNVNEAMRLWPWNPAERSTPSLLLPDDACRSLATHPEDGSLLIGTGANEILLLSKGGGPSRQVLGRRQAPVGVVAVAPVAFDGRGRRAVAGYSGWAAGIKDPALRVLRVWDLPSGHERVYSVAHLTDAEWWGYDSLAFAPDGSLLGAGRGGVHRLLLPSEPGGAVSSETVHTAGKARFALSSDGRALLVLGGRRRGVTDPFEELLLFDLAGHTSRRITTHGSRLWLGALDPTGRVIVTSDIDGVVRAGPVTGEEPHLLLGHKGMVTALAASPDGRWIASASEEAVRAWPMPDVKKPPLHALPRGELLTKLEALTNLSVVRDTSTATGWKLEVGPFPGWKDVPTW